MKKILLTVVALTVALMAGPAFAAQLIADGGDPLTAMDIGEVIITNDATNLIVTITIDTGDWEFVESHVHAAETVAAIPQTKNGNARVGKFNYCESDPEATIVSPTEHIYTIPFSAIGESGVEPEDSIVVAVHTSIEYVEVLGEPDDDPDRPELDPDDILHEETAWGEGLEIAEGGDWAMYIDYTIPLYPCAPVITDVWYENMMIGLMHVTWAPGCEEPYTLTYYLYLSLNDGPYSLLYGPLGGHSYSHDITVVPGDKYCYIVVAMYTDGPYAGNESESEPFCYEH